MKNSAGYRKTWQDKFDELPVPADAATPWSRMEQLLDKQLPQAAPQGGAPAFPLWAKLFLAGLGLSLAVYFVLRGTPASSPAPQTKRDTTLTLPNGQTEPRLSGDSINTSPGSKPDPTGGTINPTWILTGKTPVDSMAGETAIKPIPKAGLKPKAGAQAGRDLTRTSTLVTWVKGDRVRRSRVLGSGKRNPQTPMQADRKPASRNKLSRSRQEAASPSVEPSPEKPQALSPPELLVEKALVYSSSSTVFSGSLPAVEQVADSLGTDSSGSKNQKDKTGKPRTRAWGYGLSAAIDTRSGSPGPGVFLSRDFGKSLSLSLSPSLNFKRKLSGSYTHASYFRPDSIPPFTLHASATLGALTVPLSLSYRTAFGLQFQGGVFVSVPFKKGAAENVLGRVPDRRDTLNNGAAVRTGLANAVFTTRPEWGWSAGFGYVYQRYSLDLVYRRPTSTYTLGSALGSYSSAYRYFQFGLSVRLNRLREH